MSVMPASRLRTCNALHWFVCYLVFSSPLLGFAGVGASNTIYVTDRNLAYPTDKKQEPTEKNLTGSLFCHLEVVGSGPQSGRTRAWAGRPASLVILCQRGSLVLCTPLPGSTRRLLLLLLGRPSGNAINRPH